MLEDQYRSQNMTWKFGNMGSVSINKREIETWYWIWDRYTSWNMKWKVGNMGSISFKEQGMEFWYWIRGSISSREWKFCIFNSINWNIWKIFYFQLKELNILVLYLIFSNDGIPPPIHIPVPILAPAHSLGDTWIEWIEQNTWRECCRHFTPVFQSPMRFGALCSVLFGISERLLQILSCLSVLSSAIGVPYVQFPSAFEFKGVHVVFERAGHCRSSISSISVHSSIEVINGIIPLNRNFQLINRIIRVINC